MKRFLAAIFDYVLIIVSIAILAVILISICLLKKQLSYNNLGEIYFILNIFGILVFFLYFFIADYYFNGISIGKKIFNVKMTRNGKKNSKMKFSILHAILKIIALMIWPITIIAFFVLKFHCFYDVVLDISVE